ncbi:MAG: hypothetical protein JST62_08375 [Bacteroidetes bacterium]|jgi:hypothetical protein|nr:hypothetical protein [Bacteroidota bacterium]
MFKYIFYTDEGYTISPNDDILESFQILGFENGKTLQGGISNLLENNHWIEKSKFDIEKIKYKTILSSKDIENLRTLINYLWDDEKKHFEESEKPKDHIFHILKQLKLITN